MRLDLLKAALIREEGLELKPYVDTVGKITIGVGRNLTDNGISEEEAMLLLDEDIAYVVVQMAKLPWFSALDDVRQRVLADMCFNLGFKGLMSFKRTLAAVQDGDYTAAARHMLDSKWAQQVGRRAVRLSAMMQTGLDQPWGHA